MNQWARNRKIELNQRIDSIQKINHLTIGRDRVPKENTFLIEQSIELVLNK